MTRLPTTDTVSSFLPEPSARYVGRFDESKRLGQKWLPDIADALTVMASPSLSAAISSIPIWMEAVTGTLFDATVCSDSSLPFEVTPTQLASPTWVMSYVAAADADGANASRSPAASTPAIRRVMRLSMSRRLPGRFYWRLRRLADRIGMRARRQAPPGL